MAAIVTISAVVTRDDLGQPDLDINDLVNYFIGPRFDPGGVIWEREQATSRYIHGSVTVGRKKATADYTLPIDVKGATFAELNQAKETLIEAFEQDSFRVTMTFDGIVYSWQCEAADYSVNWDHVYIHNRRLQMSFSFPRQPVPIFGV